MSNLDNAKLKELMKIEPESMSKRKNMKVLYMNLKMHNFYFLLKYILKLKVMRK